MAIHQEATNIPERSILFHLEPVGLGTPYVESLTGYIARLALRHVMSTGTLFANFLAPELNKMYLHTITEAGGSGFYDNSSMVNGIGTSADECVKALTYLTKRSDLIFTTLLPWSNIMPSRGLIRFSRSWCPICYDEWYINNQEIYDPLVWSLQSVTVCPVHHTELVDICPHCGKKQHLLERTTIPGFCSKCGEWLGSKKAVSCSSELELKIAQNAGELVSGSGNHTVEAAAMASFLDTCVNRITEGNATQFASLVGISKTTFFGWHKGKNLPPLRDFLSICALLNVKPLQALSGQDYKMEKPSIILTYQPIERRNVTFTEEMKAKITEIAYSEVNIPLRKVAEEFNTSVKMLRKHWPHLCDVISAKYKTNVNSRSLVRLEMQKREIEMATKSLLRDGIYPSRRQVELLAQGCCLREKPLQLFWKEKLEEYQETV